MAPFTCFPIALFYFLLPSLCNATISIHQPCLTKTGRIGDFDFHAKRITASLGSLGLSSEGIEVTDVLNATVYGELRFPYRHDIIDITTKLHFNTSWLDLTIGMGLNFSLYLGKSRNGSEGHGWWEWTGAIFEFKSSSETHSNALSAEGIELELGWNGTTIGKGVKCEDNAIRLGKMNQVLIDGLRLIPLVEKDYQPGEKDYEQCPVKSTVWIGKSALVIILIAIGGTLMLAGAVVCGGYIYYRVHAVSCRSTEPMPSCPGPEMRDRYICGERELTHSDDPTQEASGNEARPRCTTCHYLSERLLH